jgi:predicted PurR-regulated permease PerM
MLAVAVLLLAFLCYEIYSALSPFVIAAGLVYLLYPIRHDPVARRLAWLGIILFAFWFVTSLLGILAPFIIAFLLAYVLNPLVVAVERKGIPRWITALVIVLVLIGGLIAVGIFIVPVALEQLQAITGQAGTIAADVTKAIESGSAFEFLGRFGVSGERMKEILMQNLTPKLQEILTGIFQGLFSVVTSFTTIAHQILNIIIVPFALFYLLMDYSTIMEVLPTLVPEPGRDRFVAFAHRTDKILGKYLRGAILVAAIQGCISALILWIIGVNYAIVLGFMTAVLDFIPYVGLAVSLIVASIVALFSGGAIWTKVLLVVVMYLAQKLLEATFLGPKILGHQVGLHPILLMLSLLVFGYFLGFVGLLIAVPVSALIVAFLRDTNPAIPVGASPQRRA